MRASHERGHVLDVLDVGVGVGAAEAIGEANQQETDGPPALSDGEDDELGVVVDQPAERDEVETS